MNDDEELEDMLGEGECSCRLHGRGGNDPDSYWRIDKWCPLHGRADEDAAREDQIERRIDNHLDN